MNKCEVCGREARLVYDHNHETGFVRGRLCGGCNTAIGMLGDSIEGLQRAVTYLARPESDLLYVDAVKEYGKTYRKARYWSNPQAARQAASDYYHQNTERCQGNTQRTRDRIAADPAAAAKRREYMRNWVRQKRASMIRLQKQSHQEVTE